MPRSRLLVVWGAVLMVVGVVVGVASVVLLLSGVVGGLADALTAPSYATPVAVPIQADNGGTYVVYERTAGADAGGGLGGGFGDVTVTPDTVRVTGAAGQHPVVELASGVDVLTRSTGVYTGAVQFHIDVPGRYLVEIDVPGTRVVVAPSLGSAVGRSGWWALGVPVGGLVVLLGLVLLVVGLIRGARERRELAAEGGYAPYVAPASPYAPPTYAPPTYAPPTYAPPTYAAAPTPPGWYPDPYDPSRRRYWDGDSWTAYTG